MLDLVDKYFRSDLTETEQELLSRALFDSDEAALRFEAQARETYLGFGFPEPEPNWPDGGGPGAPPSGGLSNWWWIGMTAVAVGVGTLFWHFHHPAKADPGMIQTARVGQASAAVPLDRVRSARSTIKKEDRSTVPSRLPEREQVVSKSSSNVAARVPSGQRVPSEAAPSRSVPVSVAMAGGGHPSGPVNLDQNPDKSFSGLSVVVSQAKPATLQVRVLDTAGSLVAPLYDGALGPGKWVFEWDGQLLGGKSAPAGFYRIEVKAGPFVQYKRIRIQ